MKTKEYLHRLRQLELQETNVEILDDFTPDLHKLVHRLEHVQYVEKRSHSNDYYGDLKAVVQTFVRLWEEKMDEAIKLADKINCLATEEEYSIQIEKTINKQISKQIKYGRLVLPAINRDEINIYEKTNKIYTDYMMRLNEVKDRFAIPKLPHEQRLKITDDMTAALNEIHKVLNFTRTYIAMMLCDRLRFIGMSVNENYAYARHHLKQIQLDLDESLKKLIQDLEICTDKLKFWLKMTSSEHNRLAEDKINHYTHLKVFIKTKIENQRKSRQNSTQRLLEEKTYWKQKIKDVEEVKACLTVSKAGLKRFLVSQGLSGEESPKFDPESDYYELKDNVSKATRALFTLFAVKGISRKLYKHGSISYYMDEHTHKIMSVGYDPRTFRYKCEGSLIEAKVPEKVFYMDKFGRFHFGEEGGKFYMRADCSSSYKLNEFNNLLEKDPADCGHSEVPNKDCKVQFKDPKDEEIFPDLKNIDIKATLEPEVTEYIWNSLGAILPDALADVLQRRPHNAIHYLAHRLLVHKNGRTIEEDLKKQIECEQYRYDVFKQRRDAIEAKRDQERKPCQKIKELNKLWAIFSEPSVKASTTATCTASSSSSCDCVPKI